MGNKAEARVGFAGKLIVAGRIALGAAAPVAVIGIAEACGGGDSTPSDTGQRTETPGTLPSQTGLTESPSGQSPLGGATPVTTEAPTIVPTIAPTEAPTPEPTPAPTPQITAEQAESALNNTLQVSQSTVQDPKQIDYCLEKNIPPEADYANFVINGCLIVGTVMRDAIRNGHPELKPDLDIFIGYTQGAMDRLFEYGTLDSQGRADSLKNIIAKTLTP